MGGASGCGEEVVGGVEGFSDSGKEGWEVGGGGVTAVLLRRTTRDKW